MESENRPNISTQIKEDIRKDELMFKEMDEEIRDYLINSIIQMREWIMHVVTLSGAILGSFLLFIERDKVFSGKPIDLLLFISLILYSLIILLGIAMLKKRIEYDINGLVLCREENNNALMSIIDKRVAFLNDSSKTNLDKLKEAQKSFLDILKERDEKSKLKVPDLSNDFILFVFIVALNTSIAYIFKINSQLSKVFFYISLFVCLVYIDWVGIWKWVCLMYANTINFIHPKSPNKKL